MLYYHTIKNLNFFNFNKKENYYNTHIYFLVFPFNIKFLLFFIKVIIDYNENKDYLKNVGQIYVKIYYL